MFTFNKNSLANVLRFSRDMMKHFLYYVSGSEQYHTFNLKEPMNCDENYDILSNREYKDENGEIITIDINDVNKINETSYNSLDIENISILSKNVRYFEGNKKFNIIFKIESQNTFTLNNIFYEEIMNVYLLCIGNNDENEWSFQLVGYEDESIIYDIMNDDFDFTLINYINDYEPNVALYDNINNNIDIMKIKSDVLENVDLNISESDYIRVYNNLDDIKFEAKIINVYNFDGNKILILDRYLNDILDTYKILFYKFISLSSPKIVQNNYITLPTMNYYNRFINDNSKIIDMVGRHLMITPSVIKTQIEADGYESPEIIIHNDKYITLYNNGDSISDGFYIINYKYNKVVTNNDVQYKSIGLINNDVLSGYQKLGGVLIINNNVESFFVDIENKNNEYDLYFLYKKYKSKIKHGYLINTFNTKNNIYNTINNMNTIDSNFKRINNIREFMKNYNIQNLLYDIINIDGKWVFHVIETDTNSITRVDDDNLHLYQQFTTIHKLH